MYWQEIVLCENWSYASTVSLNQNTFWIKPLYQWKIKTESVTVGSTILSHFNCANKMIYYYLLYCTHFIAGIHCQGIQKLQITQKTTEYRDLFETCIKHHSDWFSTEFLTHYSFLRNLLGRIFLLILADHSPCQLKILSRLMST